MPIYNENGTSLKENYMFGEGLYTMWQCMDHVVTFVLPKTNVAPLPDDFPQPQLEHQQCHVHKNDHTNE